jgi:uncharacterized C2H2 Zn-finger protein
MKQKVDIFTEILNTIYYVSDVDEAVHEVLQQLLFCPFCNEYFTHSSALMKHIKREHPDQLVHSIIRVNTHEVDEDAETIYICPHCHFAVDDNCLSPTSSIISHITNHNLSIDPTANISFRTSKDKELIQTYIKGTVKSKLFRCPICKDIFGDSKELLGHLCFKHSDADSKNIPVEIIKLIKDCAKDFLTNNKKKAKHKLKFILQKY